MKHLFIVLAHEIRKEKQKISFVNRYFNNIFLFSIKFINKFMKI